MARTESPAWKQSQAQRLLLQHRYLPDAPTEALLGDVPAEWLISENGLRYKLDLGRKQTNGLFLDMRYVRRWVQEQAQDKRLLNLFAYTYGFAVAAVSVDAQSVGNLDMPDAAVT